MRCSKYYENYVYITHITHITILHIMHIYCTTTRNNVNLVRFLPIKFGFDDKSWSKEQYLLEQTMIVTFWCIG
jgi:hypothetical protein